MSNQKILDYLERNIEGVAELAYFMQYGDELTSGAIMVDIEVDHFSGYEYCLAIMLLAASDIVIDRTRKGCSFNGSGTSWQIRAKSRP